MWPGVRKIEPKADWRERGEKNLDSTEIDAIGNGAMANQIALFYIVEWAAALFMLYRGAPGEDGYFGTNIGGEIALYYIGLTIMPRTEPPTKQR